MYIDPVVVLPSVMALAVAGVVGFVLSKRGVQWKKLALASFLASWLVGVAANLPIILAVYEGSDPITFLVSIALTPAVVFASLLGFSLGVAGASPTPPSGRNVHLANAAGVLPVILVAFLTNYILASWLLGYSP